MSLEEQKKTRAVYPGSFDPITNGHLDIIERSKKFCDHLVIALADNPTKGTLFSIEERKIFLNELLANEKNIEICHFEGLLVEFVKEREIQLIIRGLRAVSDFDYEYAMFQMNSMMCPEADTIFLLASRQYSFLSSSILKEFARYGRSVEHYTPNLISEALQKKFKKMSS